MSGMMRRKPAYSLYVEEGAAGAYAHVAELPGCFATGSTASKAAASAPGAIAAFLQWLRSHREPLVPEAHVSRPSMADLYIAEVLQNSALSADGGYTALFAFDNEVWSSEKLERTLRWLTYTRADLLKQLGDEEISDRHSLANSLRHITDTEYSYAQILAGQLDPKEQIREAPPHDVREALNFTRDLFSRQIRALPAEKWSEGMLSQAAPNEVWTLPKMLRRSLEQERLYASEISQA